IWTIKGQMKYSDTRLYLTLFSVLSLLVVGTTFFVAIICYRNFSKGLKQYVLRDKGDLDETDNRSNDEHGRKPIDT
ncbi:hypothetical protein HDU92_003777, partial [Lobulomyces angularis]